MADHIGRRRTLQSSTPGTHFTLPTSSSTTPHSAVFNSHRPAAAGKHRSGAPSGGGPRCGRAAAAPPATRRPGSARRRPRPHPGEHSAVSRMKNDWCPEFSDAMSGTCFRLTAFCSHALNVCTVMLLPICPQTPPAAWNFSKTEGFRYSDCATRQSTPPRGCGRCACSSSEHVRAAAGDTTSRMNWFRVQSLGST